MKPHNDSGADPLASGIAVGADVGATKLALGTVDAHGSVTGREQHATPRTDPGAIVEIIASFARRHAPGAPIGVGAASVIDRRGRARYGSFIDWKDTHLAADLASRAGVPVVACNDADAAAWAEYHRNGPADGPLLLLALGTGAGGALITGGRLLSGANGFTPEPGHIIVDPGGQDCQCGGRGCLETVTSGTAIARAYAAATAAQQPPSRHRALDAREVHRAALHGDVLARQVIEHAGAALGTGLATLAAIADPARIVLSGGLVALGDMLLEPARRALARHLFLGGARPPLRIEVSPLGGDAVLTGAALLARAAPQPHAAPGSEPPWPRPAIRSS